MTGSQYTRSQQNQPISLETNLANFMQIRSLFHEMSPFDIIRDECGDSWVG